MKMLLLIALLHESRSSAAVWPPFVARAQR
jgi:hypothetical protein